MSAGYRRGVRSHKGVAMTEAERDGRLRAAAVKLVLCHEMHQDGVADVSDSSVEQAINDLSVALGMSEVES